MMFSRSDDESSGDIALKILLLATGLILAILISIQYYLAGKDVIAELAEDTESLTATLESEINARFDQDFRRVHFLFSTPPVKGIMRASHNNGVDPTDGTTYQQWRARLETIFLAYLENNPTVVQARYIVKNNGWYEVVRAERSDNSILITEESDLQEKTGRDYLEQLKYTPPGSFYLSDIELNREYGRVTYPEQPVYRISMPIHDADANLFGAVVLNFDALYLTDMIQAMTPARFDVYLSDQDGHVILHPESSYEYSFEYENAVYWSDLFIRRPTFLPGNLQEVISKDTGNQHYLHESKIRLPSSAGGRYLDLALSSSRAVIQKQIFDDVVHFSTTAVLLSAMFMLFFAIYRHNIRKTIKLNETEAKFQAIIDDSVDAIIGLSRDGTITSWNTAAGDMLGYSERQAMEQPFTELLVPEQEREKIQKKIETVLTGLHSDPVQLDLIRRNQKTVTGLVSISPIRLSGKSPTGVSAIVRDISAQVRADQHIRQLNANLESLVEHRTEELEHARNMALAASRAKSQFIANVSHEIRTPLNGIIGMLQLIRRSSDRRHMSRYLDMAETSSHLLASLINDVLDFSKIEAERLELDHCHYNINNVVSDLALSMSVPAFEKGLEVILDTSEVTEYHLMGDPNRLRQILTNLIGNAIKFTIKGHILIKVGTQITKEDEVAMFIRVIDTGIGIDNDKIKSIFEAFTQEDPSVTRQFGGTGLGLTITRQLCKLMGGNIDVESEKSAGTTITVTLRQQRAPEDEITRDQPDLSGEYYHVVDRSDEAAAATVALLKSWGAQAMSSRHLRPDTAARNGGYLLIEAALADNFPTEHNFDGILIMVPHLNREEGNRAYPPAAIQVSKPITPVQMIDAVHRLRGTENIQLPALKKNYAGRINEGEWLRNRRILAVDDNLINLAVIRGLIEDLGAELVTANGSAEAMEILLRSGKHFDLVFMDCQMPGLDGYDCTRQIRAGRTGEASRKVPIIAMTASAMAGDRERCLIAGMDDYLAKPIGATDLEDMLVKWLPPAKPSGDLTGSPAERLESEISNYPIWDRTTVLKLVRNKEETLNRLITVFSEISDEKVEALKKALADTDVEAVAGIAHYLKGSTASVAAMRLQHLCQVIEEEARVGHCEEFPEFSRLFDEEYHRLEKQFTEYLDNIEGTQQSDSGGG